VLKRFPVDSKITQNYLFDLEDLAEDMEAVEVLDLTEDAEENLPLENLPLEIRDTILKSLKIMRLWSSLT
jgi:hypothetical protein